MDKYSKKMAGVIEECVDAWSQVQEEIIKKGLARLAAYEDTGLEPERICEFMGKRVKVVELAGFMKREGIEHLRDLVQAEKDGRLVVLPVPVGRAVYTLFCDEVVEKRIGKFLVNSYTIPQLWAELDCNFLASQTERWDLVVGKTVFLTREEAERALKGGVSDA